MLICSYECALNEEKAVHKRDEIKTGYDDLKKNLAEFIGTCCVSEMFNELSNVFTWGIINKYCNMKFEG